MKNLKYQKASNIFGKIPAGVSGVGLGVAGLSNALNSQLNSSFIKTYFNVSKSVCDDLSLAGFIIQSILISITIIAFILILLKMITSFETIKKEMKDELVSSYLPTEAMCLASIAYYIGIVSTRNINNPDNLPIVNAGTIIATIMDVLAIALHIFFMVAFLINVLFKHSIKKGYAYSSWLVPVCGIALSCSFEPKLGFLIPNEFYQITWYFALAFFIILFPYILYKHLFFERIDESKISSMAIFFAAPNLLLNGLINLFVEKDYYTDTFISIFAIILMICSFIGSLFFYGSLFKCLKIKFNFSFAAFTFPSAVGALATIKMGDYVYENSLIDAKIPPIGNALHILVTIFGIIFLIVSIIVVSYIFIKYVFGLIKLFKDNQNRN